MHHGFSDVHGSSRTCCCISDLTQPHDKQWIDVSYVLTQLVAGFTMSIILVYLLTPPRRANLWLCCNTNGRVYYCKFCRRERSVPLCCLLSWFGLWVFLPFVGYVQACDRPSPVAARFSHRFDASGTKTELFASLTSNSTRASTATSRLVRSCP